MSSRDALQGADPQDETESGERQGHPNFSPPHLHLSTGAGVPLGDTGQVRLSAGEPPLGTHQEQHLPSCCPDLSKELSPPDGAEDVLLSWALSGGGGGSPLEVPILAGLPGAEALPPPSLSLPKFSCSSPSTATVRPPPFPSIPASLASPRQPLHPSSSLG